MLVCCGSTQGRVKTPTLREHDEDQRPHVELAIHWFPVNVQCVLMLVGTGAECPLIYGNFEHFPGPLL